MKREELAKELARRARVSRAVAQDQVDELAHRIVKRLRQGQRVELSGIGKLVPGTLEPARPGRRR